MPPTPCAASSGWKPTAAELATFGGSVVDWPAFPDSAEALARLHGRFRLAVITNCDDDLFAASNRRLGVTFDHVITAQQVGSYKPSHRNFEVAFERIGVPRQRILHVAQSLFHDHVPAKELGMTTAWIDRRHGRAGSGATPPAQVDARHHGDVDGRVRGPRAGLIGDPERPPGSGRRPGSGAREQVHDARLGAVHEVRIQHP